MEWTHFNVALLIAIWLVVCLIALALIYLVKLVWGIVMYLAESCRDSSADMKPSPARITLLWGMFVLVPAMLALTALKLFPGEEVVKAIVGILGAPAIVYGIKALKDPGTGTGGGNVDGSV